MAKNEIINMKKRFLLFMFCVVIFLSCAEPDEMPMRNSVHFHPRACNYVYGLLGCTLTPEQAQAYDESHIYNDGYRADIQKDSVYSIDRVLLEIYTTDRDRDSLFKSTLYSIFMLFSEDMEKDFTAPRLPVLESQLEKSFSGSVNFMDETRSVENPSYINIVYVEYRTDEVQALTISALDAPLFGQPAGTPLNDYFEIDMFHPDFIASALTQGLVFDRFEKKPKTIREWLNYTPLASPGIFLRFSSTATALPVSTRFVVTMQTNKKFLRDTTEMIHIIR